MKIAFDAKRAFHNRRGLGNYSREVIRLMEKFAPQNDYLLLNPKIKNSISLSMPDNFHVAYPTGLYRLAPSLWRSHGCLAKLSGCNIYHGLSQELPFGIHHHKIKSVVTMHDAIFMRYPELYDPLYRKLFIQKNKYACRAADRIIAISEQTKNDIINFFGADHKKISVVYQGCNAMFRQHISDDKKAEIQKIYNLPKHYILSVGAIEKRKNLETIIRAIHMAKADIPLIAIGQPTHYMQELQILIRKLKMEKQVIFLHQVPTSDLPAIYNLATIFVYISVFEGFGIPILEALCTGVPVITSRGSCFHETGGQAAAYVNPTNVDEIAYLLDNILSDTELQRNMKNIGFEQAELFSDKKIAENLLRVYDNLIKS